MEFSDLLKNSGIQTIEQTSIELLKKFGLNWNVAKLPLSLPDGSDSGFFGITREDTKNTFATCKDGYEVFQNSELLDLVNEAAHNTGLNLTKGGLFKGGSLVYLQLKNGNISGIGTNNDTIERYVTGINSHDGSTSLKWGLTNITISCQNTFWHAYRTIQNKVKHTLTMKARIDEITKQISKVQEVERSLYDTFFKLAAAQVEKKHITSVFKAVLNIDMDKKMSESELTTYQKNRIYDLTTAINGEMKQKGESLWGLFSGVTRYTTHLVPGGDENRQQSKAIGQSYNVDNAVFDKLTTFIN
jgi:phage/plasmid-like protein (TIGR03299 family)